MEKLKELLGEDLFKQVEEKLGDKKIMVDDGNFVPLSRFNDVIQEKNQYKKQLEELKPDAEALEKKKQELWEMEKELLLEKHNLGDFRQFFHAEDTDTLEEQIKSFKEVLSNKLEENQQQNIYKPESHKNMDKYAEASKNKDVQGMIGQKLSSIFK